MSNPAKQSGECQACLDNKELIVLPCGHASFCSECTIRRFSNITESRPATCLVCSRASNQFFQETFTQSSRPTFTNGLSPAPSDSTAPTPHAQSSFIHLNTKVINAHSAPSRFAHATVLLMKASVLIRSRKPANSSTQLTPNSAQCAETWSKDTRDVNT